MHAGRVDVELASTLTWTDLPKSTNVNFGEQVSGMTPEYLTAKTNAGLHHSSRQASGKLIQCFGLGLSVAWGSGLVPES